MGNHSETLGPAMKSLLLLLFPLAFALPAQDQLVQLESNEDFVIGSSCTIEHLPNFYEECKIWIESPTAPLEDVLQCFIEVVKFFDNDGEVRQGVKEFLGL